MAASSINATKTIGVVQKIQRKLGYVNNIAMDGKDDPGLIKRYGKDKKPKILFFLGENLLLHLMNFESL